MARINRFHNHPHSSSIEQQLEPPTSTFFAEEKTYELRINDDTGMFTLNILPDQKVVIDKFENISFRKYLYENLDVGVYDWLSVNWRNHQKDNVSLKETRTTTPDSIEYFVQTNRGEYMIRRNKHTGLFRYAANEKGRDFELESMYVTIPELPLMADVNLQFRQMLADDGFDVPPNPYELGFTISNKDQAA